MDYMTLKEASEKWGVSSRQINYYCTDGRIPGAVKMAGVWLIPKTAEKPIDGRTKQGENYAMNKILIIDDDRELCALIKRSVQSENIEADF